MSEDEKDDFENALEGDSLQVTPLVDSTDDVSAVNFFVRKEPSSVSAFQTSSESLADEMEISPEVKIGSIARELILERESAFEDQMPSDEQLTRLASEVEEFAVLSSRRAIVDNAVGTFQAFYRFISSPVAVGGMAMSVLGLGVALNIQMTAFNYQFDNEMYADMTPKLTALDLFNEPPKVLMRGSNVRVPAPNQKSASGQPPLVVWQASVSDPELDAKAWQNLLLVEKIPYTIKFEENGLIRIRASVEDDQVFQLFKSKLSTDVLFGPVDKDSHKYVEVILKRTKPVESEQVKTQSNY